MNHYVLYGWHLSYFTAKVRCYLRYKRIPFEDTPVNLFTLMRRIKRKTGAVVMPVVVTPDGEWLQDSSVIIDRLEGTFSKNPIVPATPVQRFASYLMEAWCDEFWIPIAMHTRWSYPENYALFESDAGAALLPHFPRFVQNRPAARAANAMRSYLPRVGIVPEQIPLLDAWAIETLDDLDRHFAGPAYLFGSKPSLADFALAGPLCAHLGRDPWPKRELIAPRKNLAAWIGRMAEPSAGNAGAFLPGDGLAPALDPIFHSIFSEFLPMLESILAETLDYAVGKRTGMPLPRGLGQIAFPMGGGQYKRHAIPYTLWMAQRCLDAFSAMTPGEQDAVRAWLEQYDAERILSLKIPRLRRNALSVAIESAAA